MKGALQIALPLAVLAACTWETAIFSVGSEKYYRPEFERYIRERLDPTDPFKSNEEVLSRMLDRFVNEKVFERAIREKQLDLDPDELDQAKARIHLGDKNSAPSEAWLQGFRKDLLRDKYIRRYLAEGVDASEEEVSVYYQSHQDQYKLPERFRAREIVVYDRSEAEKIRRGLLRSTPEQFAEVARKQSKGPSAADGGQMGVRRAGQLPQDIEAAILPLKVGEISPVVQTSYGFHIFLLEARLPSETLPLDAARESIRKDLVEGKIRGRVEDFVRAKRKEWSVKIYPGNLGFKYVEEVHN